MQEGEAFYSRMSEMRNCKITFRAQACLTKINTTTGLSQVFLPYSMTD